MQQETKQSTVRGRDFLCHEFLASSHLILCFRMSLYCIFKSTSETLRKVTVIVKIVASLLRLRTIHGKECIFCVLSSSLFQMPAMLEGVPVV